ncbi:MAG: pyruvate dehydrogenase complex dihydrolipoamide acetyltransferase [Candidatus Nucleicultricaceae bacterium]
MPVKILMPALSPTMTEGNLVKWHKKQGDAVKAGDLLAEIETDKATMEVEAVDEGRLGRILVSAGTEDVPVNALIGVLLEEGEDEGLIDAFVEKFAASTPVAQAETVAAPQKTAAASTPPVQAVQAVAVAAPVMAPQPVAVAQQQGGRIHASPLARRLASERNINLATLQGSGPRGRIVKADLDKAPVGVSTLPSVPQKQRVLEGPVVASDGLFPPYEEIKLTNMRKVIARRLQESKQTVPHFYLTIECEIDDLLKARMQLNASLEKDAKLSVNDFIIRACALALRDVPDANASFADNHVKRFLSSDVSVAVAIEGGLVTPIIRQAESKSLYQISAEAKQLIQKARAGKLAPEEFQGGTFSLSNLGMYGITSFQAVVNPPQGCILAVGAGVEKPVVKKGAITVATIMECTLSADHRVVDGAVAAQFLQALKMYLTEPIKLFAA